MIKKENIKIGIGATLLIASLSMAGCSMHNSSQVASNDSSIETSMNNLDEIINEEVLKVDIDVMIEGTIKLEEKEEKEDNNIQPDIIIDARKMKEETKEDIPKKDYIDIIDEESESMQLEKDLFKESDGNVKEVINQNDNEKDTINQNDNLQVTSIFENFDSSEDKYISYYVHIVRENENIEGISMKYNISLEDLKEYNNMDEITLGSKIIIPYIIILFKF